MPQPCRVAIVGAGNMARVHAQVFRDVPGVTLAGIHSRTRSRAEAFAQEFGIPDVCDSVAELYERTGADLVVVAIPVTVVRAVSESCFAFPWTVFMEKPPGLDMAEALAVHASAQRHGRRVLVALNRRFLSSARAALAQLADVAAPRFIQVSDQQDRRAIAAAGHPPAIADNLMFNNSIHVCDLLRCFGRGRVVAVTPVMPWDPERSDPVVATVEFDSGDRGLYVGLWEAPGPWSVTVNSADQRWELRPLEKATYQIRGDRQMHAAELSPWDEQFRPGFRLQAEMAVAAALGQPAESPTLEQALETMALIEAIYYPHECVGQAWLR